MERTELIEWIAMLAVIVLWWPVLFLGWSPPLYYYPLTAVSVITVLVIFRNRFMRMQEGLETSEEMMEQKRQMERQARGGKPNLEEDQPPDVSSQMPFAAPADAEGELPADETGDLQQPQGQRQARDKQKEPRADAADQLPFVPPTEEQQPPQDITETKGEKNVENEADEESN